MGHFGKRFHPWLLPAQPSASHLPPPAGWDRTKVRPADQAKPGASPAPLFTIYLTVTTLFCAFLPSFTHFSNFKNNVPFILALVQFVFSVY